jgi:hypothetical protein
VRPLGLVVITLALSLAACGGNGGGDTVRVEASECAFATPTTVEGGVVSMEFANVGEELHEYPMARLQPGKTMDDFRAELAAGEGSSSAVTVPSVSGLSPGEEVTITQALEPGTHVLFNLDEECPEGVTIGSFEVEGDSGAELPEADGAIVARESSFDVPELTAGTRTVELRNVASEVRDFHLFRLHEGKSLADATTWFDSGKGPAPFAALGAVASTDPSAPSVYLTLELEAGRDYVLHDRHVPFSAQFSVK